MEHEENIEGVSGDEMLEYLDDSDEANLGDDYFNEFIGIDIVDGMGQGCSSYSNVLDHQHEDVPIVPSFGVLDENIDDLLSELEDEELYEEYAIDEDEDKSITRYYKYNPNEMCKDFKFSLGMEFTSIKQFRDALKEHSLLNGYAFDYIKNDKERCRVKCTNRCGWLMFVSKESDSLTYRLKTLNPRHACGVTINAKRASSEWIAEKIVDNVKINKDIKLSDVQATIRKDYMAQPSINKAFRARKIAREMIEGNHKEEYAYLRDYCLEVKSNNPRSTFCLVTDKPYVDHPRVFRRLYMCLELVKRGFKVACRPIIGLDGCFLKGPYGGILLVVVARDPNEQYFPLAMAVVETENRDSWTSFLKNLFDDIGTMAKKKGIGFKVQGLVQALGELLGGVEHRYCVRHLYANIKARYGGGTLVKDLVICTVKATYPPAWEGIMNELKKVSKNAYDHLMTFPLSCWTKAYFDDYFKSDMIMNNISESFNGQLLEARERPIIGLLDWIRTYLMDRFHQNRVKAEKYRGKGSVCPQPRKRLDKEIEKSRKWEPRRANNAQFEVSYNS
ncbi:uncharacterized protein LOC129308940 [Prosopis cineraria]|uniref:uncharacterized protein LOC129308940 n=1 Tax=Prosopis cineraria TaxID=364024 RepID=UPI00240EB343|nr:uncharacterized protein LOC129308940 [Prosopis cineraria]